MEPGAPAAAPQQAQQEPTGAAVTTDTKPFVKLFCNICGGLKNKNKSAAEESKKATLGFCFKCHDPVKGSMDCSSCEEIKSDEHMHFQPLIDMKRARAMYLGIRMFRNAATAQERAELQNQIWPEFKDWLEDNEDNGVFEEVEIKKHQNRADAKTMLTLCAPNSTLKKHKRPVYTSESQELSFGLFFKTRPCQRVYHSYMSECGDEAIRPLYNDYKFFIGEEESKMDWFEQQELLGRVKHAEEEEKKFADANVVEHLVCMACQLTCLLNLFPEPPPTDESVPQLKMDYFVHKLTDIEQKAFVKLCNKK